MAELQNGLPPGWDSKLDEKSGKYYYINHYTRTTTWDDPRTKHRPLQATPKHMSNVPVEHIPLQDMPSSTRIPLTLRSARVQDSSFTSSHSSTDSDDSVAKLSAMFPTVSETHIKLLLKKYLNREALVISALQIEKYPITTPGPFSTPPPQRNIHVGVKGLISRTGSPLLGGFASSQGFRSSPKPHSSPKLKLRYMKSIFPNADETVILECLQNNENSIQKTSETLREMGYSKKETVKPATPKTEPKVVENAEAETQKAKTPPPAPKLRTSEEKLQMKQKLQEQYKDVAEHLISIALESVHFDEHRANQILQIMKQEDTQESQDNHRNKTEESTSELDGSLPSTSQTIVELPISQSRQSLKSLLKSEKKDEISSFSRVIDENSEEYKSANLCNTVGHKPAFSKGPNEKLLLENYVQWQGTNKAIHKGPQGFAKGPNKSLLSNKLYKPCGPNADLRKGSAFRLAKGSIFTQMKAVVVGESRVK